MCDRTHAIFFHSACSRTYGQQREPECDHEHEYKHEHEHEHEHRHRRVC